MYTLLSCPTSVINPWCACAVKVNYGIYLVCVRVCVSDALFLGHSKLICGKVYVRTASTQQRADLCLPSHPELVLPTYLPSVHSAADVHDIV